ncbi:MAG: BolA/IbaG family iron-sulfur metabolism protein [Nannocystaceae bacterium]
MSEHPTDFSGSITDAISEAIQGNISGAVVEVSGGGGHYTIAVTSAAFAGKSRVAAQRLVYSAIAHLMAGDRAPVHAVDNLRTIVP